MITDLAAQEAMDKLDQSGFDALADSEKTLVTVWLFEAKVANGGFKYYYESAAGDLAFHAPDALESIGATQLAGIALEANRVFGANGPPKDREARAAMLKNQGDSMDETWQALEDRFFECEEETDPLLEAYLERTKPALSR